MRREYIGFVIEQRGLLKVQRMDNQMLGLCTRYSEAGVVHTAWHWIGAMYEVRASMDIDKSK